MSTAEHVLTNGQYRTVLTAAGAGYSAVGDVALTRWTSDPTLEADGFFLLVRDVEGAACWSAGLQPVRRRPDRYEVRASPESLSIEREDDGMVTRTEVCVSQADDAEVRRTTLINRSDRSRVLDVTTYAEVVLATLAADEGHPAFTKLFVQTEYGRDARVLVAKRRPRSPDEAPLWLAHALTGPESSDAGIEWETDRARFIGRGRSVAWPRAMDHGAALSGTTGNVLDPIFSLRRRLRLAVGEQVHVSALLCAGPSREGVIALASRLSSSTSIDEMFGSASTVRGTPVPLPVELDSLVAAPAKRVQATSAPSSSTQETLLLDNGFGGFSEDGTEYVIRMPDEGGIPRRPPLPWINVVANEQLGFLVSESGAGYTWAANSRENRLTPWLNDPVADPHADALWIRDDDSAELWSPTPGPTPGGGDYEARHGFGYTRFLHTSHDLEHELVVFVPRGDPVRIARLRLTNRGGGVRRLSVTSYAQLVLGGTPRATRESVVTRYDTQAAIIFAENADRGEFSHRLAFAAASGGDATGASASGDRESFLGRYGDLRAPASLRDGAPLDGRFGAGLDPCAALQISIELEPGASTEYVVLLGECESETAARAIVDRYRDPAHATAALAEVQAFWRELFSAVRIATPSLSIDLMVNGWLAYQNLCCRLWARSAFYQSGGAFGFRDQLQDSAALVYFDPSITRNQILLHAAHQFVEGDVMHWWHPPASKGIRTRFADDLLWLPLITAFYIDTTGDASILGETARFLTARALEPGEDEAFLIPEESGEFASVYEHCCRALDRSMATGERGLPLMGTGDWNDGMNRVGRLGRGESVWLGFFLYDILGDFIPHCERRDDRVRAERYERHREMLRAALEDTGWDGRWYRRAYYDDGTPLGSAQNDECRIDTIAQAWSVISGAASAERAEMALDAMETHLVSEREGLIRLLTPAFDKTPHDPGYIKGYLPGVRENGGQYTHGALWAVRALAEAGRGDRAATLLAMLSPVSHARTPDEVATYQVEPYVIAADVYGVAPHVGRGGWTWYTGSAGWMWRVALESVLGVRLQGARTLTIRPSLPREWPGYSLWYRAPGTRTSYEISVRRHGAGRDGSGTLDGEALVVNDGAVVVPLADDGGVHRVEIRFGKDAAVGYVPD